MFTHKAEGVFVKIAQKHVDLEAQSSMSATTPVLKPKKIYKELEVTPTEIFEVERVLNWPKRI